MNPGSPRREIASSNAFRGIRSRAATSFASSAGVDDGRVDAGADELVGDHVARGDPVRTGGDRRLPQPLEPAGDEHERALVVEDLADPPDPRRRKLRQLAAEPLDHLG